MPQTPVVASHLPIPVAALVFPNIAIEHNDRPGAMRAGAVSSVLDAECAGQLAAIVSCSFFQCKIGRRIGMAMRFQVLIAATAQVSASASSSL